MSLVKTLAKAAIGIAVAKGLGSIAAGAARSGGRFPGGQGAGTGAPYDRPTTGGSRSTGNDGNLMDALGKVLGGRGPRGRGSLGSAMEELSELSRPGGAKLDSTGARTQFDRPGTGSFGDLLDQSLEEFGEPRTVPSRDQEELAGLLLRALLQAAKADGQIDASEKQQLLDQLGELDRDELEFVNRELAAPIDVAGVARSVPKGSEAQVYTISVMGIDLDTKAEARYLQELARALGIAAPTANAIHDRLGEPRVFR